MRGHHLVDKDIEFYSTKDELVDLIKLWIEDFRKMNGNMVDFWQRASGIALFSNRFKDLRISSELTNFSKHIDDIRCTTPPENYRVEVEKAYAELIANLPDDIKEKFDKL